MTARPRNNWPLVKFGDMAQNVTDRVDPAEADAPPLRFLVLT